MATPEERRKELRRNPTNYLARANMGKYRAYLRNKLKSNKNIDENKVDVKLVNGKPSVVMNANKNDVFGLKTKPIERKNIKEEKSELDPRARKLLDKEITKVIRDSEGTATIRKNSNPPKFETKKLTRKQIRNMTLAERQEYNRQRRENKTDTSTQTESGAKGRKERRGTSEKSKGITASDALTIGSMVLGVGLGGLAGRYILKKGGQLFVKTKTGQRAVKKGTKLYKTVVDKIKKKETKTQQPTPRKQPTVIKQESKKQKLTAADKMRIEEANRRRGKGFLEKKDKGGVKKQTREKLDKEKSKRGYDETVATSRQMYDDINKIAKKEGVDGSKVIDKARKVFRDKYANKGIAKKGKSKETRTQYLSEIDARQYQKMKPELRKIVDELKNTKPTPKEKGASLLKQRSINKQKQTKQGERKVAQPKTTVQRFKEINERFRSSAKKINMSRGKRLKADQLRQKMNKILTNPKISEAMKKDQLEKYIKQLSKVYNI